MEASKEVRDKIVKAIEKGNVVFREGFLAPDLTLSKEEVNKLINEPEFLELEMTNWGEWHKEEFGNKGGINLQWSAKGIGCGHITMIIDNDGKLVLETECMSKNFVKKAFCALIDRAIEVE